MSSLMSEDMCQNIFAYLAFCPSLDRPLWIYLNLQGLKKLEEVFQFGRTAVDDLLNVAKVIGHLR